MCEVVERLDDAIGALLELDPDTLTDSELQESVVAVQRCRARLGAAAANLLSRWDHRGVWAGDRSRSAASRLARDTRTSVSTANVELRRARQLRTMPATADAVAAGELSLDHVDLLARANRPLREAVFADHEPILVAECAKLRFADATKLVAYWCQRADAEAIEADAERQQAAAHLHASTTIDGDVVITGVLDPLGGAVLTAELNRLERDLYLADRRNGVVRSAAQRRAAALVEMAKRSATAPAAGRRPKPLFTVLLGDQSFARLCELANGKVVTPGALKPWLDDADLETILFDGPTTIISVSPRRNFVGAIRRAIEVRDRHCQHPSGCDVPADRCDVDHIVPRAAGGQTSQFNGRIECTTHNRHSDKHDHGAVPLPPRPVTRLDELRARLRWRYVHEDSADDDDSRAG
jgi:Domain of unknown function (DUF222)